MARQETERVVTRTFNAFYNRVRSFWAVGRPFGSNPVVAIAQF
jgi:hypothetical protein